MKDSSHYNNPAIKAVNMFSGEVSVIIFLIMTELRNIWILFGISVGQ